MHGHMNVKFVKLFCLHLICKLIARSCASAPPPPPLRTFMALSVITQRDSFICSCRTVLELALVVFCRQSNFSVCTAVHMNATGVEGLALFLFIPLTVQGKVHPCTSTEALYRPYGS